MGKVFRKESLRERTWGVLVIRVGNGKKYLYELEVESKEGELGGRSWRYWKVNMDIKEIGY